MAEAFGVDAARLKIVVFVYAALLACVSGWLYAHLQRFVNPTPFGLNQGIEYLFMAVVGGAGSVWGAVVGAALVTLLKTQLQDWLPTLLGPQRQFRDRRLRHPDGRCCCSARATGVWPWLAGLLPPAHAAPDRAGRAEPRRRAPRRPPGPLLDDRARAQAIRRPRRRQRPVVRDRAAARSSG